MKSLHTIALPIVLVLLLLSAACQPSTIVSSLEAAVSAAEIAIPVIGAATGLNPQTTAAIVGYLHQVNIATAQAATILAGPGTPAQKSAAIAKAFLAVAKGCNCVPPGTPQQVVIVIEAVVQAVSNFLTNVQPKGVAGPAVGAAPAIKITATDRAALANLRTRSLQNEANLKGVQK